MLQRPKVKKAPLVGPELWENICYLIAFLSSMKDKIGMMDIL
jgi:hypothetical protein